MSLHSDQIVFKGDASALWLGKAIRPAAGKPVTLELEQVAVSAAPADEKVVAGIRAAAEKAKSPEVGSRLGTIADMMENGQKPEMIANAVNDARNVIKETGGDFNATRQLLQVSRVVSESLGKESGIVQDKQAKVPETINSDIVARAAALAEQKYGAPAPRTQGEEVSRPMAALVPAGVMLSRKTQLS